MPRELSDKPCEVTFFDRISESKMTFYYDLPATEDRVAYTNSLAIRRGNKIESNVGTARLKYGAKILRGFKEGAFKKDGKLIASDPKSANYDPAWKTFVRQYAPDCIEMLAMHVFETSLMNDTPDEEEDGKTENPL